MIVVYHASNSIEAYLIKNLLEQQELLAYVFEDLCMVTNRLVNKLLI